MFEEEKTPPKALDLERLSVEDLEERIETLKAEIVACEAELSKKRAHKSAADSLFGGSS
ncbi:MAG: DUF1192 domain-containing protein [Pseudomonadota bacterium]